MSQTLKQTKATAPEDGAALSYADKFRQMDREALGTLVAAIAIFIYFWLTIFLFKDDLSYGMLWGMPLWFTLSCIGGYLLSVVAVFILINRVMRDFDLGESRD